MRGILISSVALWALTGCSDFAIGRTETAPAEGAESTEAEAPRPLATDHQAGLGQAVLPGVEEVCDGRDNNGDGAVDEGFDDVDNDGVADCVDVSCWVAGVAELESVVLPECASGVAAAVDPWDVAVLTDIGRDEVPVSLFPTLADLDGDGLPEISAVEYTGNGHEPIVAWSFGSGQVLFETVGVEDGCPVVAGDVDGDGHPELFGYDEHWGVVAFDSSGFQLWRSEPVLTHSWGYSASFTLADLSGSGVADVVTHTAIIDSLTGVVKAWRQDAEDPPVVLAHEITVADLDLDGFPEILSNWMIHRHDGSLLQTVLGHYHSDVCVPIPVQADVDLEGEVLWFASPEMVLTDDRGVELARYTTPRDDGASALPCAADLDQDGLTEVIFPDREQLHALQMDGTYLWQIDIDDPSAWIGCTTVDLDLDGGPEVLFIDHSGFHILDGRTGTQVFGDTSFTSLTAGDVPYIVDVDNDGSTEIVASAGTQDTPLRVYSHATGQWPPGLNAWPVDNWSGVGLDADLKPVFPIPPTWLQSHQYRGQPAVPWTGLDLVPDIVDSCIASCDGGEVRLSVRLTNGGPKALPYGTPLAVYLLDATGIRSLWGTVGSQSWLPAGMGDATVELVFTLDQVEHGLVLVAGDDGTGTVRDEDCDLGNNEVRWTPEACAAP